MNVLIGLLVYNRLAVYHKENKNILKQHSPPILGICHHDYQRNCITSIQQLCQNTLLKAQVQSVGKDGRCT